MNKKIIIGIVLMLVIGMFSGCIEPYTETEINCCNLINATYGNPLIEEKDNETTIIGFQTNRPGHDYEITVYLWDDWRKDLRLRDIHGLTATWYGRLKTAWLYNNTVSITYRNLRGTDYIMAISMV